MNFTVSSKSLLEQLNIASKVISNKNSLQILDNYLFELEGNNLTITASDVETTIVNTFKVQNPKNENGLFAIEAKRLLSIIKEFPEQPLTIQVNDVTRAINIISENGKFSIVGNDAGGYPPMPIINDDVNKVSMTTDVLLQGIGKTIFATSADELRPTMTGLLFEVETDKLRIVATDAHKLTKFELSNISATVEGSFILPQKPANILKSILPKEKRDVTISYNTKNVCFEYGETKLICRSIEGIFPKYSSVIPLSSPLKAIIDRASFCNAIKRVSTCSNWNNLIKLSFDKGQVNVSAKDFDFNTSANEIVKCQYDGEPMEIGFKSDFLVEILNNLDTTSVNIELTNPSKPCIVSPFYNEQTAENIIMLLMAMNLDKYAN